jgi:hypothetical protein
LRIEVAESKSREEVVQGWMRAGSRSRGRWTCMVLKRLTPRAAKEKKRQQSRSIMLPVEGRGGSSFPHAPKPDTKAN